MYLRRGKAQNKFSGESARSKGASLPVFLLLGRDNRKTGRKEKKQVQAGIVRNASPGS